MPLFAPRVYGSTIATSLGSELNNRAIGVFLRSIQSMTTGKESVGSVEILRAAVRAHRGLNGSEWYFASRKTDSFEAVVEQTYNGKVRGFVLRIEQRGGRWLIAGI